MPVKASSKKNSKKSKSALPRVKDIREGAGISIRQLALKAGVDRTKISRWERGQGLRMVREAMTVAKTLGTDVATLFGEGK